MSVHEDGQSRLKEGIPDRVSDLSLRNYGDHIF